MQDAPLSALMAQQAKTPANETYDRFVAMFRTSTIGVVAAGMTKPDADGRLITAEGFGVGRTTFNDGRERIMAFADPEVFLRRFGPRFNAGVPGEVLLRMAADDPECEGILVNSALEEVSIIISKDFARWVLSLPAAPA